MSYRVSKARRLFEAQTLASINELKTLYVHAKAAGAADRLLAVYYVYAFTQLEVYVKTLVSDAVSVVEHSKTNMKCIPKSMLAYSIHRSTRISSDYKNWFLDGDENKLLRSIEGAIDDISTWATGKSVVVLATNNHFLDKKTYPSPKNLPNLFRRLGIDNIWNVAGQAGKINAKFILTSLNDLRTEIAHDGQVPSSFSLKDVIRNVKYMRKIVSALDRGVSGHFCPHYIQRSVWNQLVA